MKILYGSSTIDFSPEDIEITRILAPAVRHNSDTPPEDFENQLPFLKKKLSSASPDSVAIICEDKTRINPEYPTFLNMIRDCIAQQAGNIRISLVVAYGTHQKHTLQEHIALYGKENIDAVNLVDHDCRDIENLVKTGTISNGHDIFINKTVAEADFIITLSTVAPHSFAGFTGGRKAILPGVSDYASIRRNHSKVGAEGVGPGLLAANPVHIDMVQAARTVHVDFAVQIVRTGDGKISRIFSGELDDSFNQAVKHCREINSVPISRKADIVVASCGGHPKDRTLYQSQRAITTAVSAVRPGGLVVVFGQFADNIGNRLYEDWLSKPVDTLLTLTPDQIEVGIHSAYLTARNFARAKIVFYSDIPRETAKKTNLEVFSSLSELNRYIRDYISEVKLQSPEIFFIPNASSLLIT
ncbi:MAG: nickel-dependent lactate racemase [Actinomycetia bacterium]|nr:nickel-dependent lactate racemase [Actinomycetes bacterium]